MTNFTQAPSKRELTTEDLLSVAEAALARGGSVCVPADGLSMGKRLSRAKGLYVRQLELGRLHIGSILVYRSDGEGWTAHRVIWPFRNHPLWVCLTKGDAYGGVDVPFVRPDQVIGEVVAVRYPDGVVPIDRGWRQIVERGRGWSGLLSAMVWECAHSLRHRRWRLRPWLEEEPEG